MDEVELIKEGLLEVINSGLDVKFPKLKATETELGIQYAFDIVGEVQHNGRMVIDNRLLFLPIDHGVKEFLLTTSWRNIRAMFNRRRKVLTIRCFTQSRILQKQVVLPNPHYCTDDGCPDFVTPLEILKR